MNKEWGAIGWTECEHCRQHVANNVYARHVEKCPWRDDMQRQIKAALTDVDGFAKTQEAYDATRNSALPSASVLASDFKGWYNVVSHYGLVSRNNAKHRRAIIKREGIKTNLEIVQRFSVSSEAARKDLIAVYGKAHRGQKDNKRKHGPHKPKEAKAHISLYVPLSDFESLRDIATEQDCTVSAVIRQAIHEKVVSEPIHTNGTGAH